MLVEQRGGWSLAGAGSRALRTMLVADDADVALALAASGAGIAQLPEFAVAEARAAGELRALLPGDASPPARIAASVSADAARPALTLLDHLAASLSGRR